MRSKLPTLFLIFSITVGAFAQGTATKKAKTKTPAESNKPIGEDHENEFAETSSETKGSDPFERLLQGNGLIVGGAYLQEDDEIAHSFTFTRSNDGSWRSTFGQAWPLSSGKHQLSIEMPSVLAAGRNSARRGFGDAELAYSYFLFGNNSSRLTVSPTFELSLPTGNFRKELGAGHIGFGARLPVSAMLSKHFQLNSSIGMSYTPSARNDEGERASIKELEVGQSIAWVAHSRFNLLFEATWERSQCAFEDDRETEHALFISPGVQWAHKLGRFVVTPGVAFPIGVGPSRRDRCVLFSIAFEHRFKKEREE